MFLGAAVAWWKPSATTTTLFGGWPEEQAGDRTGKISWNSFSSEVFLSAETSSCGRNPWVNALAVSVCGETRKVCPGWTMCTCRVTSCPTQPVVAAALCSLGMGRWWIECAGPQALQDTLPSCHMYTRWHTHHCPMQLVAALMAHGPGRLSQLLLSSKKTISGHLACSVKQPLWDILSATNNWKRPT